MQPNRFTSLVFSLCVAGLAVSTPARAQEPEPTAETLDIQLAIVEELVRHVERAFAARNVEAEIVQTRLDENGTMTARWETADHRFEISLTEGLERRWRFERLDGEQVVEGMLDPAATHLPPEVLDAIRL